MLNIGQDIWTHEARIHEVVMPFVRIPMHHRMTVFRLASGEVVLHSPTQLSAELRAMDGDNYRDRSATIILAARTG